MSAAGALSRSSQSTSTAPTIRAPPPRAPRRGRRADVLLFGPGRAELAGDRRRGRRRAGLDRQGPPTRPAPPARRPTPRSSRPPAPSPRAAPTRSSPAARPAPRSPRACSTSSARRASTAPRSRIPLPVPGAPVTLLDVGANDVCRPEHLVQFAYMGAALAAAVLGVERPRVGAALQRDRGRQGPRGGRRGPRAAARRWTADFVGNVEGFALTEGVADVIVTDGFTGNVAAEGRRGRLEGDDRLRPRARRRRRRARRPAALLLRPALRGLRDELDPEAPGRRLPARAAAAASSCRTARSAPRAGPRRSRRADRGVREDVIGRTYAALEGAGALRRVPASDAASSL